MAIYLTFDIGTTSLKTALVDSEGRALAVEPVEYTFQSPRPDWAEMPPETYWQAAVTGTRAVFAKAGVSPSDLAAIGFSSQGETFVPLDSAGRPLYNAIVWTDNRAQDIVDEWGSDWLSRDYYRAASGYPWLPAGLTLFKIEWLRRNAPDAHKAWKFLCLPDYLIYRMTGETVTDHVIAQFSGLFDLRTDAWGTRLLEAAGITEEQLPTVLRSGQVAGLLRPEAAAELGVPAGVNVCVGSNDQIAGAVGAGNVRPGMVTETTGTSLALVATTPDMLDDTRLVVGRHAEPSWCYAMSFTVTSAIVLKWFRDLCAAGQSYDEFLAEVETVEPGCDGLTVLPHFAGTAFPTFDPNVRGAFAGLALGHTRAHIARAIMESCACMLRECLEPITAHGLHIGSVRSLGGAARSDAWLQMKADMLGAPVERPVCSDAGSLGAAMLAAVGTGQFASIDQACEAWYRPERVFEPNPSRAAAYDEVYGRYIELYRRLYGQVGAGS